MTRPPGVDALGLSEHSRRMAKVPINDPNHRRKRAGEARTVADE